MSMTWEQVAEVTGAEMVGGTLQLRLDGKMVSLGQLASGAFNYTVEGGALVASLENPPEPDPAEVTVTTLKTKAGKNISLGITESVITDEELSS